MHIKGLIINPIEGTSACDVGCDSPCPTSDPCLPDGTSIDGLPHYDEHGVYLCGPGHEEQCHTGFDGDYPPPSSQARRLTTTAWYRQWPDSVGVAGTWYYQGGPISINCPSDGDYCATLVAATTGTGLGWELDMDLALRITGPNPRSISMGSAALSSSTVVPDPWPRQFIKLEAGDIVEPWYRVTRFVPTASSFVQVVWYWQVYPTASVLLPP